MDSADSAAGSQDDPLLSSGNHLRLGKFHRFLIGPQWLRIRLSFRTAAAIATSLAINQNRHVAELLGSLGYLSNIFVVLYMPDKTRIGAIEFSLTAGLLAGLAAPICMLIYLCVHAVLDPRKLQNSLATYQRRPSPAAFYQDKTAAVAAVWLFIVSYVANVVKTVFVQQMFAIFAILIFVAVICLDGYLSPTWAFFYGLLKQLLYAVYIANAISLAFNLFIFPYNAREPFFEATAKFLYAAEALIAHNARHLAHTRSRFERVTSDLGSGDYKSGEEEKQKTELHSDESAFSKLKQLRASFILAANQLKPTKSLAKREIAIGHLAASDLSAMNKFSMDLITGVLGCNLWSQISELLHGQQLASQSSDEYIRVDNLLNALGGPKPDNEERKRFLQHLDTHLGPRILALGDACCEALEHIQKGLHLGPFRRPPLWARALSRDVTRWDETDAEFSNNFELRIQRFWGDRTSRHHEGEESRLFLLPLYMEASMHGVAEKLLAYCRWVDERQADGTMRHRKIIIPQFKLFRKALGKAVKPLITVAAAKHGHMRDPAKANPLGLDGGAGGDVVNSSFGRTDRPEFVAALLKPGRPPLDPHTSLIGRCLVWTHTVKRFFESPLSGFGLRGAVAMLSVSLPAYFASSVYTFTEYRFLWISLTVFLGLQPVVGRAIFASVLRVVGTIAGGILGLVVFEIGRVSAGIIPVFFVVVWALHYIMLGNRQLFLIPMLLTYITMILIIGYELLDRVLGREAIERSGQKFLSAPKLMGWRILLTLAGVVVAIIFSVFPSLPTSRDGLREMCSNWLRSLLDTHALSSVRLNEIAEHRDAGVVNLRTLATGATWRRTSSHTTSEHETVAEEQGGARAAAVDRHAELDKAIRQVLSQSIAINAQVQMMLPMTSFELSVAGKFPRAKWDGLVACLSNLSIASAVSAALLRRIALEDDPTRLSTSTSSELVDPAVQRLRERKRGRRSALLASTPRLEAGSNYFRTVNVVMYCLSHAIQQYQVLPPGLPSPMKAHIEAQAALVNAVRDFRIQYGSDLLHERQLVEVATPLRRETTGELLKAGQESPSDDVTTYFGAWMLVSAVFAEYLEQTVEAVVDLTGRSGFHDYFQERTRARQTKAE
ncbi:hypothetical protein PYCC9005_000572 [Savitreella phatthalungensis]